MFTKLVSFTLVALFAVVQDVEIKPRLVQGDKFRVEVTRTRRDTSRPQMNVTGRNLVDVEVVSAAPSGFVLDWVPGDTSYDNPQVLQDPTIAAAAQAAKGMRFRISLNADGEFTSLLNEAEVRPKLQTMIATIIAELAGRLPANQRKGFQDMMGQLLSPGVLISSATQDAQIYWGLNGVALAAGKSVTANVEQPNPMGGSPVPATFRVSVDAATNTSATLTTTTTFGKDALAKMTLELAQRAGAPVKPEDAAKLPAMDMADDGRYEFDRVFGLMRRVAINRRISAGALERVDSWVVTLVESPKR